MNDWLVSTDLDGTLLDESYPETDAVAVLQELLEVDNVWITLSTSKTLAELMHFVEPLRALPRPPFLIFENGGGLALPESLACSRRSYLDLPSVPGYRLMRTSVEYKKICDVLGLLVDSGFQFRGFAEMSCEEVSDLTGLSRVQAGRARQRLTSEPLVWLGDDASREEFAEQLCSYGLTLVRGGRFYHVSSGSDKQQALEQLVTEFQARFRFKPRILACGDAPNDLAMLESADRAVVFPGPLGYLRPKDNSTWHAPAAGPLPWLAAVRRALT